jgi:hypothetical protein
MSSLALSMLDHEDSEEDEAVLESSYTSYRTELPIGERDEDESIQPILPQQTQEEQKYASRDLSKPRLQFRSVSESPATLRRPVSSANVISPKSTLRSVQSNAELSSPVRKM